MVGATGYQEHAPRADLSEHVACFWTSDVPPGVDASHVVLPDGCIDLLFEVTSTGAGRLEVVGTMSRALWVRGSGPTRFLGARFKPGGASALLRERAVSLTDRSVEATAILGGHARDLSNRLQDATSFVDALGEMQRFLGRLRDGADDVDPRVRWGTRELSDAPMRRIDDLSVELGISRQYARRLFLEHVGLSPKAFARVARLERAVGLLRAGCDAVDAALTAGYADQAHLNRDFKALVGATPSTFLRSG